MKVAICISGLSREFKRSYKHLKEHLFSKVNHDLFIYTWNAPDQPHFEIEGSIRYPDEGTLEEYRSLYKPTTMDYEVFDKETEKEFDQNKYYKNKHPHASVVRMSAMWYQMDKCNKLKNEYAAQNNIKYDIVIKCRSDLSLFRPISNRELEDAAERDIFYTDVLRSDGMVSDILFFGNTKVMDYVCQLYRFFDKYNNDGIQFNPEIYLPHHLKQKNIPAKEHFIGQTQVLRPEQAQW